MDDYTIERMRHNGLIYKRTLERIIDKYSKLKDEDGGIEVDLETTDMTDLGHYMNLSKKNLSKLESKSQTDLREHALRAQDITGDTQLDYSHRDNGADETDISSVEPNEMSAHDSTQLSVSSLDESQMNSSETELQPEDQDEELEKSLSSQGSSLVELYPSMISQIGKAWHRQHVSEAADSVLRRYRRLRWQSNRGNLNHTFNITLRHTNSNPKMMNTKAVLRRPSSSSRSRDFPRIPTKRSASVLQSPLHTVTDLQDWHTEKQSPRRQHSLKNDLHRPVLVMNFSSSGILSEQDSYEPKDNSLNQTFTMSQVSTHYSSSQQRQNPITLTASPRKPCCPTTGASMDPSLRSEHLSLPSHTVQRVGGPMYVTETSTDSASVHYSPVRQGSLRTRLMTREGHSGSPLAYTHSRSPRSDTVGNFSRESKKPRSLSASPTSPLHKSTMLPRRLYLQDSHGFSQPKPSSPQSSTAAGHHRFQRRLSFDSSFLPSSVSYPPRELEDEFQKLYHRFVCQGKSSFSNGRPCRVCARSSEVSRGHSSSALAALALSPHRSVLRKRHRELEWDSRPQSKRLRNGHLAYSPGSRRHGKEMLKHLLSPNGVGGVMAPACSIQQPSDTHQEGWMTQAQLLSSEVLGGSPGKAKWQSSSSPRRLLNTFGQRSCPRHLFSRCHCTPVFEN